MELSRDACCIFSALLAYLLYSIPCSFSKGIHLLSMRVPLGLQDFLLRLILTLRLLLPFNCLSQGFFYARRLCLGLLKLSSTSLQTFITLLTNALHYTARFLLQHCDLLPMCLLRTLMFSLRLLQLSSQPIRKFLALLSVASALLLQPMHGIARFLFDYVDLLLLSFAGLFQLGPKQCTLIPCLSYFLTRVLRSSSLET